MLAIVRLWRVSHLWGSWRILFVLWRVLESMCWLVHYGAISSILWLLLSQRKLRWRWQRAEICSTHVDLILKILSAEKIFSGYNCEQYAHIILEYGFQKSNRKRKLAWCENRVSSKVIFSDDSGANSLHYVNMFCSLPSSLCILKIVAVPSMPLLVVMW